MVLISTLLPSSSRLSGQIPSLAAKSGKEKRGEIRLHSLRKLRPLQQEGRKKKVRCGSLKKGVEKGENSTGISHFRPSKNKRLRGEAATCPVLHGSGQSGKFRWKKYPAPNCERCSEILFSSRNPRKEKPLNEIRKNPWLIPGRTEDD